MLSYTRHMQRNRGRMGGYSDTPIHFLRALTMQDSITESKTLRVCLVPLAKL